MSTEQSKKDVVEEARELLSKITPWPWMYRPNPGGNKEDWAFHIDRQGTPGRMDWGILIAACWSHVSESAEANAALIARAPELLSSLIEEVLELRRRNETQATSIMEFQEEQRAMRTAIDHAMSVLALEFPGSIKRKAAIAQLNAAISAKGSEQTRIRATGVKD